MKNTQYGRSFLVACTRLYNPLCPSVGRLVGRSVRNALLFSAFTGGLGVTAPAKLSSWSISSLPLPTRTRWRLTSTFFPDKSIYNSIYTAEGDLIHNLGRFSSERQQSVFPWNAIKVWTHIQEFQLSHEVVSEVKEQARERSEQAKQVQRSECSEASAAKRVQRSRALWSKRAEWAVRANGRSERPSGLLNTRLSVTRNVPLHEKKKTKNSKPVAFSRKTVNSFSHDYSSHDMFLMNNIISMKM